MSDTSSPPPASAASSARASITTSAIMAGICALSPVPFVDDLFIGAIRRHAVRRIFRARGKELTWGQARALTRTHRNLLVGCLLGVVVYPIRKIFRKVFYIFAVKEAVAVASRLLHQGRLVEHALASGCLSVDELGASKEPLSRLNVTIQQTCDEANTDSILRIFEASFAGGRAFLRSLGRRAVRILRALSVMRQPDAVDALPGQLEGERERGLLADLHTALLGEEVYFAVLTASFDERWAKELQAGEAPQLTGGEE